MKKVLLTAAAALAIAAPGVAAAQTSGFVGVDLTSIDDEADGDKENAMTLEAAMVTNVHGMFNLQIDAEMANMDHDSHVDTFSSLNLHGFYRSDVFAVGGLVGLDNESGSSRYNLGVEGQFYLPRATLTGAYTYSNDYDDGDFDIHNIDVNGQFFLTPHTALGANLGWTDSEWTGQDGFSYGLTAEHQFAGTPFSLGAHVTRAELDYSGGGGHDVETFGVFGRWNFGTPDLQMRSTTGASLIGGSGVRNAILQW